MIEKIDHEELLKVYKLVTDYLHTLEKKLAEIQKEDEKNAWWFTKKDWKW